MKHPSSREMFRYWTALRGHRPAPTRADIDPTALRKVLGDSFILSVDPAAGHPIQLAGTRVCALFSRELKDVPFLDLWDAESRPLVESLVAVVTEETIPVVAGALGQTNTEQPAPLEILLLPLSADGLLRARLIGVLAPLAKPYWLGMTPIETLTLGAFRHMIHDAPRRPILRVPRQDGPHRPNFVVYEGGAAARHPGEAALSPPTS